MLLELWRVTDNCLSGCVLHTGVKYTASRTTREVTSLVQYSPLTVMFSKSCA